MVNRDLTVYLFSPINKIKRLKGIKKRINNGLQICNVADLVVEYFILPSMII